MYVTITGGRPLIQQYDFHDYSCKATKQVEILRCTRASSSVDLLLADRKISKSIMVDGESSSATPVKSGVPQGMVLGPLMFLVYINDINENITSSVRLFADDCIIYMRFT